MCVQEHDRWQDVLRVAKEYLPNRLQMLQDEYDKYMTQSQGVNASGLLSQARAWELQGEFSRAVDCYFKVHVLRAAKYNMYNVFIIMYN